MKAETAGLVLFGLAEPVQVMSGFLPSPATAEASAGNRLASMIYPMVGPWTSVVLINSMDAVNSKFRA